MSVTSAPQYDALPEDLRWIYLSVKGDLHVSDGDFSQAQEAFILARDKALTASDRRLMARRLEKAMAARYLLRRHGR